MNFLGGIGNLFRVEVEDVDLFGRNNIPEEPTQISDLPDDVYNTFFDSNLARVDSCKSELSELSDISRLTASTSSVFPGTTSECPQSGGIESNSSAVSPTLNWSALPELDVLPVIAPSALPAPAGVVEAAAAPVPSHSPPLIVDHSASIQGSSSSAVSAKTRARSVSSNSSAAPSKRRRSRLCQSPECTRVAQTGGFCIRHGGGRRCTEEGCDRSAQGGTDRCKRHGGGKRCQAPDCDKSAEGSTRFCKAHGGGKRCTEPGCDKSAVGAVRPPRCIRHGGGRRCSFDDCERAAQGRSGFCIRHGGGRRCAVAECERPALPKKDLCRSHTAKGKATKPKAAPVAAAPAVATAAAAAKVASEKTENASVLPALKLYGEDAELPPSMSALSYVPSWILPRHIFNETEDF